MRIDPRREEGRRRRWLGSSYAHRLVTWHVIDDRIMARNYYDRWPHVDRLDLMAAIGSVVDRVAGRRFREERSVPTYIGDVSEHVSEALRAS